jgi:hypothetical protein
MNEIKEIKKCVKCNKTKSTDDFIKRNIKKYHKLL